MSQQRLLRTGGPWRVAPLTPERWDDLVALFGRRGAYAGCWCMYWRLTGAAFSAGAGRANRERLRELVESPGTPPPGLLAYAGDEPAGWCAVGPREAYGRLERSPHLKPVDDRERVWSIVCFYVAPHHRRRGLLETLVAAAVEHARSAGAEVLEAYPRRDPDPADPHETHQGFCELFSACGFVEVARRVPERPIMRRHLGPTTAAAAPESGARSVDDG